MRINFGAVFVIYLVEFFRNYKAHYKGNKNKNNSDWVQSKVENTGCKKHCDCLHAHVEHI